jgi:hypothetical protein
MIRTPATTLVAPRHVGLLGLSAASTLFLVMMCMFALGMVGCIVPNDAAPTPGETMSDSDFGSDYAPMAEGPDGWSSNGILIALNYTKTVNLQAQFDKGGPGDYTAEFSISPPPFTRGAGNPVQAEALITWAIEGNFVTRRISISNGATISGVAQAVRIQIMDVSNPAVATAGQQYGVSVQVTKGIRATTMQPPTLTPHPSVDDEVQTPIVQPFAQATYSVSAQGGGGAGNGNGFIELLIPQDAGVISVFITVAADNVFGGTYQAQGTAPVIPDDNVVALIRANGADQASFDPRAFNGWIPLIPGAATIDLINGMAAGQPSVTFSIWFGIDG